MKITPEQIQAVAGPILNVLTHMSEEGFWILGIGLVAVAVGLYFLMQYLFKAGGADNLYRGWISFISIFFRIIAFLGFLILFNLALRHIFR